MALSRLRHISFFGAKALSVIWCNQSFPRSILKSDNSDYPDHYTFLFSSPTWFPAAIMALFQQHTIQNSKVQEISPLANAYTNKNWRFNTFKVLISLAWIEKCWKTKCLWFGWLLQMQPQQPKKNLALFKPNIWHPGARWLTTKVLRHCSTAGRTCLKCVTDGEHDKTACASLLFAGVFPGRTELKPHAADLLSDHTCRAAGLTAN